VAAGNVISPVIPSLPTSENFQREVRERLLTRDHALTDPACAVNALTVGSIARTDVPSDAHQYTHRRPRLVGAPALGPSPFTRAGIIDTAGGGVGRTIKPDLVAYGGNYCLGEGGHGWNMSDAHLGEPSLRHNYEGRRLVRVATGTSVAAPFVTHICARVSRPYISRKGRRECLKSSSSLVGEPSGWR
jgi:Subtilase family